MRTINVPIIRIIIFPQFEKLFDVKGPTCDGKYSYARSNVYSSIRSKLESYRRVVDGDGRVSFNKTNSDSNGREKQTKRVLAKMKKVVPSA